MLCNYINARTRNWDLSQEIVQKTFVKLWEKRDEISFSSSSKSYLFQATRNTLIDYYRSKKSSDSHEDLYAGSVADSEEMTFDDGCNIELVQKISWAVSQLKPKTKEIFLLNKKEGLTYDEIAQYMDISKRTVEYNMKSALMQLKELLKDKV